MCFKDLVNFLKVKVRKRQLFKMRLLYKKIGNPLVHLLCTCCSQIKNDLYVPWLQANASLATHAISMFEAQLDKLSGYKWNRKDTFVPSFHELYPFIQTS